MAITCHLVNDSVFGFVDERPCGSGPTPLYQSVLDTPPDGSFFAEIDPTACTVTFTFHQCDGRMTQRSFTPGDSTLAIVLTVPDVRSITANCTGGNTGSTCSFEWDFELHYCHCCKEN